MKPIVSAFWPVLAVPALATSAFAAVPEVENMGNMQPGVVELISRVDVGLQIRATGNPTSFNASNLPDGLEIDRDTGYIKGEADDPGTWDVTISATNADGTGTRNITFLVWEREPALPISTADQDIERGLDLSGDIAPFTQWTRSSEGNAELRNFFYRITGIGQGSDVIRNSNATDFSDTAIRTYVMGPSQVTFTWWCNIETNYDFFSFYVNEVPGVSDWTAARHPTNYITGVTSPTDFSVNLGPGLHRLEWVYSKDYNDAAGGQTRCILDNIRVTGYADWADGKNLAPFEAGLDLDKEQDNNDLLTEYALGLRPDRQEMVYPLMTFEPDGRAVLSVDYDDNAYGVTVDIEKSTSLAPGSWSTSLEPLSDSGSFLRRRETSPQSDAYYRVKVSSP